MTIEINKQTIRDRRERRIAFRDFYWRSQIKRLLILNILSASYSIFALIFFVPIVFVNELFTGYISMGSMGVVSLLLRYPC